MSTQTYKATGTLRAGGEGSLDAHGLSTPFDGTAGRLEALPGPADVLCACILKNVERFSHILPFACESATITVTAYREEPPPHVARMTYELELVTAEPASRVELLHRNIQKFGTITNTLSKACEVTGNIRVIATGTP